MNFNRAEGKLDSLYREKFCSRADDVFRLGLYLYSDESLAKSFTKEVFSKIGEQLFSGDFFSHKIKSESTIAAIYSSCWSVYIKNLEEVSSLSSNLEPSFSEMHGIQRGLFVLTDIVGLASDLVQSIVSMEQNDFEEQLQEARRIFIDEESKL